MYLYEGYSSVIIKGWQQQIEASYSALKLAIEEMDRLKTVLRE